MEAFHLSKQLYRALLGLRHYVEALYLFTMNKSLLDTVGMLCDNN